MNTLPRVKTDQLWSSRYSAFKTSVYESGGAYPPHLSEVISKIELSSVIDIVQPKSSYTVLDIGAGGGRWTLELADKIQSITAIEPSDLFSILKQRTTQLPNVNCLNEPFETFVPEQLFHLVICSGVLVYLKDQEVADGFLMKALKCLRKGGYLILREPVARRMKYSLDWAFTDDDAYFENGFATCQYWEVIRPEQYYTGICIHAGAKKMASFPSHAPFFYHLNLPTHTHTEYLRNLILKHITLGNLKKIVYYNRLLRKPYGFLRYLMNLRTMKIMIFQR